MVYSKMKGDYQKGIVKWRDVRTDIALQTMIVTKVMNMTKERFLFHNISCTVVL